MAVQVSKRGAIKRLMYFGCSIEDYTTRCKLKLTDFSRIEVGRDGEVQRPKV
jgi:hypothetical protein